MVVPPSGKMMRGENLAVSSIAVYRSVIISMICYLASSVPPLGTKMASTMRDSGPINGIVLKLISQAKELFRYYVIIIVSCYVT